MTGADSPATGDPDDELHDYELAANQPCSVTIVYAVADVLGRDPLELPELLYNAIDVDALDALFSSTGRPPSASPSLSFEFCGLMITVQPEGLTLLPESS
ncbi:HalOD1 output domain-containing protein [Halomarina rubra]|uniref:HalOD1 output domain-containing protein n=1 Tax=Halomarina rubra TaxID=2071873 RepID=A0ABD6AWE6_9EURY